MSKWMSWQRGLDKYGKIPDKEISQIVDEYRKLNPEEKRSEEPVTESKPQDEVKERLEELKTDTDKLYEEMMNKNLKDTKPYYDEWKRLDEWESGDSAKAYKTKHPEVEQYEYLKTIKDAISRWRKDAREGDVSPEKASEEIRKELDAIKK